MTKLLLSSIIFSANWAYALEVHCPTIVAELNNNNGRHALVGELLYTRGWNGEILVYDVADLANPNLIDTIQGISAVDFAIWGNRLEVLSSQCGRIYSFSINDPFNITQNSWMGCHSGANSFDVYGNYDYVTNGSYLKVYDLTDPRSPQPVFNQYIGPNRNITIEDGVLYSSYWGGGGSSSITSYSLQNAYAPAPLDTIYLSSPGLASTWFYENHIFVSRNGSEVLEVVDKTDPSNMFVSGEVEVVVPWYGRHPVQISNDRVVVSTLDNQSNFQLVVYDYISPLEMTETFRFRSTIAENPIWAPSFDANLIGDLLFVPTHTPDYSGQNTFLIDIGTGCVPLDLQAQYTPDGGAVLSSSSYTFASSYVFEKYDEESMIWLQVADTTATMILIDDPVDVELYRVRYYIEREQ